MSRFLARCRRIHHLTKHNHENLFTLECTLPRARHRFVATNNGPTDWTSTSSALGILGVASAAITYSLQDEDDRNVYKLYSSSPSPSFKNNRNSCSCESLFQLSNMNTSSYNNTNKKKKKKEPKFCLKQVYEIEQVLGEGAYGMVYAARRKSDNFAVALKTMPREYTGRTDFEREVAALQRLSQPPGHDHVVQLYDLHRDDDNYYLVMELIEGDELLEHLIENGPYSEGVAASFMRQFAEAIHFVHCTGLTHADLKPENLMISSSSSSSKNKEKTAKLKLVDFGCACNHDLSRKDMQLPAQEFALGCSFLHQVALGNNKKNMSQIKKMVKKKPLLVNFRDYDRRTALHIAASEGHVKLCRYLVENGALINRSDRWGGYPLDDAHRHKHADVVEYLQSRGGRFGSTSRTTNLITAASEGDVQVVKALLKFSNINANQGDYDRRTALHLAANEGHLSTVELLCQAGASVNVEDRWGNRPLDDARRAKMNSDAIVHLLRRYGATSLRDYSPSNNISKDVQQQQQQLPTMYELKEETTTTDLITQCSKDGIKIPNDEEGMMHLPVQEFAMGCSVLHQAALGNQFELEKILQEFPTLVNFRDYDRRTALHIAASEGHIDICRYLVAKGARINRSDRWGGSPLDDAHRHGHADVAQFLRHRGGRFGSASQVANFITAASDGDEEEVKALLEFGHIDVNQGDYDRRTALHLAAGEGRFNVVELLCKAGANANVEDRWGNRPLDDAKNATSNSTAIVNLLQKHGATSSLPSSSLGQQEVMRNDDSIGNKKQHSGPATQKQDDHIPTGTIAYCPPELFVKGSTSTPTSDMWATGVIMYILLTGSHPFDKYSDRSDDDIRKVVIKLGSDKKNHMKLMDEHVFDERIEGLSESCVSLMRNLMHPDPEKRMSSEDFLQHPWIQGLTASWKTMGKTHDELKAVWQDKFRTEILKKYATPGGGSLSEKELGEIFQALDLKKNGVLELDEIMSVFRGMGISESTIRTIFSCADLDGTGVIHWEEFQALMKEHLREGPGLQVRYLQQRFKSHVINSFAGGKTDAVADRGDLRKIFKAIDLEGNGVLNPHEIRVVLRSAGEPEDVISRIIASLDLNHDGGVSWDEFLKIMSMTER